MMREWRFSQRQSNGDESVAALVERHYGAEMVDRVADPLLSGVYGGEASQLSVRAVLPRFAEMESQVRQPGSRHAGRAQENDTVRVRPASHLYFAEEWNAAVTGRDCGTTLRQTACTQILWCKRFNARIEAG